MGKRQLTLLLSDNLLNDLGGGLRTDAEGSLGFIN